MKTSGVVLLSAFAMWVLGCTSSDKAPNASKADASSGGGADGQDGGGDGGRSTGGAGTGGAGTGGAGAGASCGGAPPSMDGGVTLSTDGGGTFTILDPKQDQFGKSYGEWGAEWWKWIQENPGPDFPQLDPTGAHCGDRQSGEVFFLVGVPGGIPGKPTLPATRSCTVPAGKSLFIILMGISAADKSATATSLQIQASRYLNSADTMTLSIDGATVGSKVCDFAAYRAGPTQYAYTLPDTPTNYDQTVYGTSVPGVYDPAFAMGYYVMLAPLTPGSHTIHYTSHDAADAPDDIQDITYHLTAQ